MAVIASKRYKVVLFCHVYPDPSNPKFWGINLELMFIHKIVSIRLGVPQGFVLGHFTDAPWTHLFDAFPIIITVNKLK